MTLRHRIAIALVGAVLVSAAITVAGEEAGASRELAALQAVDQAWLQAYNAADAQTLASLYAEDAVLLAPGTPAVHGREAIHAYFASDVAASQKAGVTTHLGDPDGGVSGDMGWCSGTYSVTDKDGHVVDTGKYLSVSRKEGGAWRYVRDTWNSDLPATPAPAEGKN